jgi:zinc protease
MSKLIFNASLASMRSTLLCGLLLFSLSTAPAQDGQIPDGIKKLSTVEGITEYLLESNGLRILLFPDLSKPTITVNVTYLVGSRHEGYGETGMAHLLEHLVFKGTPRHPNIPQELTERGARPNGTTWYDRTNYFETFNATDDNLRWALDLEADRMINSFIAKKDLDSEMTVVRNEFEMGENFPSSILRQRVLSNAYLWHNYGNATIGARADIENVPIERLQAFYRKYYQPDNAVLMVTGKIDEAKTLGMIKEYFGPIPRPQRTLIPTYTAEPIQDGERSVTLRRVGEVQATAAAYHICAGSHPDYAAIAVIVELLTNQPSGRLYKALVESKKATSVGGFAPALKEPGYVYFSAEVLKDKSLEEANRAMLNTLDELKDNPPTEEEVNRARARLLKNFEMMFKNSEFVGLRMSEYIAAGDWRLAFLYRDNLEAVTADEVARVAAYYFKPSNRTVGFFLPEEKPDRVEIPETPDVAMLVKDYQGKEAIAEGEAFDPSPENIETRTFRGGAPTFKYALLPKETRGNAVIATITLRLGDERSLLGKSMISQFTASMLDKGTTRLSRQQIQDELDRLKARASIFGGSAVNLRLETERAQLPELIRLVGEILKSPAFPENEFEKLKEARIANIEEQLSEPTSLASRELSRLLRPYPKSDVRYIMTFDEELEAIKNVKLEDVKAFYEEFYGASGATISVVGDFDREEIEALFKEVFGDWKSKKPYRRIASPYLPVASTNKKLETPDKSNAMFFAGQTMPIRDDHPDYPALVLGNYMLGGGFLNSRLATRIRQNEGLSYGVGANFFASALDESGTFTAYAIYAPENVKRLEEAFHEEIEKVVKEGFSEEEVSAAKSGWLQSRQVARSQDASLVGVLNNYLEIDRDLSWDAQLEEKIAKLTPAQINQAMKKHLSLDKMIIVKAGDFAKVEKELKP